PYAPGAPRPLGTTAPSAPLADARPGGEDGQFAGIGELIQEEERVAPGAFDGMPLPQGAIPARPGPSVAATSIGDPQADFDMAYAAFSQKDYDRAEIGFRRFLQSNPRDGLVPEATFWLGETYLQKGRHREAAE